MRQHRGRNVHGDAARVEELRVGRRGGVLAVKLVEVEGAPRPVDKQLTAKRGLRLRAWTSTTPAMVVSTFFTVAARVFPRAARVRALPHAQT